MASALHSIYLYIYKCISYTYMYIYIYIHRHIHYLFHLRPFPTAAMALPRRQRRRDWLAELCSEGPYQVTTKQFILSSGKLILQLPRRFIFQKASPLKIVIASFLQFATGATGTELGSPSASFPIQTCREES